jgi:hypothetical protein
MERAKLVPSNINVDTSNYPAVTGFLQQAETAGLWRITSLESDSAAFQANGEILNTMVERAVFNDEDATEVVNSLLDDLENLGEASP